jgi:hypothetical protein
MLAKSTLPMHLLHAVGQAPLCSRRPYEALVVLPGVHVYSTVPPSSTHVSRTPPAHCFGPHTMKGNRPSE